jgi:hypothetical protein
MVSSESEPSWRASGERPEEPTYRPISRRAKWVIRALVVSALVDLAAVFSGGAEFRLLDQAQAGKIITEDEAYANDLRQALVGIIQTVVFFASIIVFLAWFRRAYRNLPALGAWPLRYGRGWAIGSWFVPILNYFRPKQIANDIWRASNPEAPADQGATWQGTSVPKLFAVWWLAFVVANALYTAAFRLSVRAEELSELKQVTSTYLWADILSVLAAVLAVVVVRRTTARQDERALALGFNLADTSAREPGEWRWVAAVVPALLAVTGLFVYASWEVVSETPGRAAGNGGGDAGGEPGVLVEDDFSRPGTWLVQDDKSLTFDYTGGSYRILVKEREAFWSSLTALPEQVGSMSVEVDLSLHAGRVRTDFYGVGCVASSQGAYLFGISPDGYYTVALDRGQTEEVEVGRLVEESGRPFRSGDAPNRLRAECVGEEDRAVLRLFVNGRRLVETTDRPGLGRFVGLQFFVYSGRGGTDVRFDNLAVRKLPPP